ncbi:MAG: hypothetical protein WD360_04910 [Nitriliruptoraceae bacterium]
MAGLTPLRMIAGFVIAGLLLSACAAPSERRLVSIREGELAAGYLRGQLLYVETRGVRESVLFRHDLWENKRERIRVPEGFADSPTWSPDGERIAFSLTNRAGQSHIWVVNEDGSDPQQLTFGDVVDDHPSWAPNGEFLVFGSIRDGDYDWRLFVVRVPTSTTYQRPMSRIERESDEASSVTIDEGFIATFRDLTAGEVRSIASDDGHSIFPDWSPDGRFIVYSNRDGANYNLRIHDVTTGTDRLLVDSGGDDMQARFAPDGARLLYTTNFEDDLWQIWSHDFATEEQTRIIGSDSMDEFPAFSYDAEFIAFSTGHLAIYRADAEPFPDGQLRWAVTINLAWSPDWKAP